MEKPCQKGPAAIVWLLALAKHISCAFQLCVPELAVLANAELHLEQ